MCIISLLISGKQSVQNFPSPPLIFGEAVILHYFYLFLVKVGLVDLDICGPSVPKLMAVEGKQVINSPYGWTPLK